MSKENLSYTDLTPITGEVDKKEDWAEESQNAV